MGINKIELKVAINCEKCKIEYMKVVAKLQGVDEITVNVEKGTLIVVGEVDPVCVANELKKAKKFRELISFGPNKKPEEAEKSKSEPPTPSLPPCCKQCQLVGVSYSYDNGGCSIM